jgi:hypothetical protein
MTITHVNPETMHRNSAFSQAVLVEGGRTLPHGPLDIRKRGLAVQRRLASAEQVEVGSVEHHDSHHRPSSRSHV